MFFGYFSKYSSCFLRIFSDSFLDFLVIRMQSKYCSINPHSDAEYLSIIPPVNRPALSPHTRLRNIRLQLRHKFFLLTHSRQILLIQKVGITPTVTTYLSARTILTWHHLPPPRQRILCQKPDFLPQKLHALVFPYLLHHCQRIASPTPSSCAP